MTSRNYTPAFDVINPPRSALYGTMSCISATGFEIINPIIRRILRHSIFFAYKTVGTVVCSRLDINLRRAVTGVFLFACTIYVVMKKDVMAHTPIRAHQHSRTLVLD